MCVFVVADESNSAVIMNIANQI